MSDEKRFPLHTFYFLSGAVCMVLALVLRLVFGYSIGLGVCFSFLSLVIAGLSLDFLVEGKKISSLCCVTAAWILSFGGQLNGSPVIGSVLLTIGLALANTLPLLSLFLLVWKRNGNKKTVRVLSVVFFLLTVLLLKFAVDDYSFLHIEREFSSKYQLWIHHYLWCMAFSFLSLGVWTEGRSYLFYLLLVLGGIAHGFADAMALETELNILGYGKVLFCSISVLMSVLILFIYIMGERSEELEEERSIVKFTNMVYEELTPVKRKPRPKKMEIPPNVPKFKRDIMNEKE